MLFNSLRFLFLFLPVTMVGFHLLGRYGRRPVIVWLALMSVVFYAAWNTVFVLFLLGSILVNFLIARAIDIAPPTDSLTPPAAAVCSSLESPSISSLSSTSSTSTRSSCVQGPPSRQRQSPPHPSSSRNLLLHLHPDLLPRRSRPRASRATGLPLLSRLRHLLPPPHRRPHPPPQGDDAPVRQNPPRRRSAETLDESPHSSPARSPLRASF